MRAAHRAAGQPIIWKWDVFERPYYTWDTFERPYYTWDVYNRAITSYTAQALSAEVMGAFSYDIPFAGGYYYSPYNYATAFNSATGKFTLTTEITGSTSKTDLSYSGGGNISDESGASVDKYLKFDYADITKNEALSRFEIRSNPLHNNTGYHAVATYGKGSATGTTVTSFASGTYPADGYDAGTELYYVRRAGVTKTPVGTAVSFANTTYPTYGYDVGTDLWYEIRAGWTKTPTGDVAWSVLDDTYPEEGYDAGTDLWYERR